MSSITAPLSGTRVSGARVSGSRVSGGRVSDGRIVGAPTRSRDVRSESAARAVPAATRTRLRLTRRGRVVLGLLVVLPIVVLLAALGVGGSMAAAGSPGTAATFQHVTVDPGESLWQIAEEIAPKSDPRDVVQAIVDLNQLQSAVVYAGESLAIPTQYALPR